MKRALCLFICLSFVSCAMGANRRASVASWYGEDHRGRLMANGQRFDPDKMIAASWFYPLGTKVRVTLKQPAYFKSVPPSVVVTITDRGPAWRLVRQGRKIDLAAAAFKQLAHPALGLIEVTITPEAQARM